MKTKEFNELVISISRAIENNFNNTKFPASVTDIEFKEDKKGFIVAKTTIKFERK